MRHHVFLNWLQTLKCNVDLLRIIQLGLSFTDGKGNWPNGCACWQFNFKFSLRYWMYFPLHQNYLFCCSDDLYAQDSIEMLRQSGIDFEKFEAYGIDVHHFGELLMVSGLVLNDDVRWLSFHSSYDFGYLLKLLTCKELPDSESGFLEVLQTYFPSIYDTKVCILLFL
jgi:CCR4-NOT transcription complex subunit 7/8